MFRIKSEDEEMGKMKLETTKLEGNKKYSELVDMEDEDEDNQVIEQHGGIQLHEQIEYNSEMENDKIDFVLRSVLPWREVSR